MNLLRLSRQAGKTRLLVDSVKQAIRNKRAAILIVHSFAEAERIIEQNPELDGFVYSYGQLLNDPQKKSALRNSHVEVYIDNIDLILTELFGKAPHIMSSSL